MLLLSIFLVWMLYSTHLTVKAKDKKLEFAYAELEVNNSIKLIEDRMNNFEREILYKLLILLRMKPKRIDAITELDEFEKIKKIEILKLQNKLLSKIPVFNDGFDLNILQNQVKEFNNEINEIQTKLKLIETKFQKFEKL